MAADQGADLGVGVGDKLCHAQEVVRQARHVVCVAERQQPLQHKARCERASSKELRLRGVGGDGLLDRGVLLPPDDL